MTLRRSVLVAVMAGFLHAGDWQTAWFCAVGWLAVRSRHWVFEQAGQRESDPVVRSLP